MPNINRFFHGPRVKSFPLALLKKLGVRIKKLELNDPNLELVRTLASLIYFQFIFRQLTI